MSDTTMPGAAAPSKPAIFVYGREDGSLVANVHQSDRLRTVFARNVDELKRRVVSALISEFRLPSEEAEAVADEHGLKPGPSAADMADLQNKRAVLEGGFDQRGVTIEEMDKRITELLAHLTRLDEEGKTLLTQLDVAHKEIVTLRSDLDGAQQALKASEKERAKLQEQLDAANTAATPEPEVRQPDNSLSAGAAAGTGPTGPVDPAPPQPPAAEQAGNEPDAGAKPAEG